MKMLFLIAVVSSIGYLAYQELPRIEQILSTSSFQPDNTKITMESVKHEMQKKLDDVTSEREALYELLAKKEALLMARTKQSSENEGPENENNESKNTVPLANADKQGQTIQYKEASKRREALRELAQRMELHALGLSGNDLGVDELAVK